MAQICPKLDLGSKIQKTNAGIRISILDISCVPIFRQNEQLWLFRPKFSQKWILGSEFQKSKCRLKMSISKKQRVTIFSQYGQFGIFGLNLGKLTNYVQYIGSNNIDGVAESWVEAEMSWVHGLVIPNNNFVKSTTFKICDIIIGIASRNFHLCLFLLNPKYSKK